MMMLYTELFSDMLFKIIKNFERNT